MGTEAGLEFCLQHLDKFVHFFEHTSLIPEMSITLARPFGRSSEMVYVEVLQKP